MPLWQIDGRVRLKRGRGGPARGGNPWIFSQAIERLEPDRLHPGATVEVRDGEGELAGYGHYNPNTTIAVRLLSWGSAPPLDQILELRLQQAIESRQRLVAADTNCFRIVNGEGDGLPGLVVDRYADVLVLQFLSAGMDLWRESVVAELQKLIAPASIVEHSHGAVRRREGLKDRSALLAGEPVEHTIGLENGLKIWIDLRRGQKTGHFLDQRLNRLRFAQLAPGARVLDLCCYSGSFAVAALRAGAGRVVAVDTSAAALSWAKRNLELNGFSPQAAELVHAEVAHYLAGTSEDFDLIVLDPPPLARSRKDAPRAERLYTELNTLALRKLARVGYFMTFSCSVHFRLEDFTRAVRFAQAQADRRLKLVARLCAAPDHPVLLGHPEGEYLTGLLLADLG